MLKRLSKALPLLFIVLILAAGVACQKTEALSADQVVEKALAAQPDVKSLRLSMNLAADVEGSMEGEAIEGNLTLSGTAIVDQAAEATKADFDLTLNILGAEPMDIETGAQVYLMNGYLYAKIDMADIAEMAGVPDMSQMWLKMAVPAEISASMQSMEDVTGLMESAQVEMVGEEKAGGVNCYVLRITPDFEALQQALTANPLIAQAGVELPDMENLISSMSFKVWVAKDTYFLMKSEVSMTLELTPEALGEPEGDDHMTINLTLSLEASEYNKAPSIQLPTEAQTAIDVSNLITG